MSGPKPTARSAPSACHRSGSKRWSTGSPSRCWNGGRPASTRPSDGVIEPALLRRSDGASVYSVAGADLYTSTAVLAAEQRLIATAGRTDGRTVPVACVDVALLEMTANGIDLDPGQADLVRRMATSGARLQLAIAPAGTGKTTAMHTLATAWTSNGGHLVGLGTLGCGGRPVA